MKLNEKYRLLFFKYLYDQLGLSEYETYLQEHNIECITNQYLMCNEEISCSVYSKYFYLLNEIDLTKLNDNEIKYLESIDTNEVINGDTKRFLNETYQRVLLNNGDDIYYGPLMNDDFKAAANEIALGIKFDEYGLSKGILKDLEVINVGESIVDEVIKTMEEKNRNYSLRVIRYNELFEKLNSEDIMLK